MATYPTIIKKWNGSSWEEAYPKTTHTQLVASGTADSTTFLRGDGVWATPGVGSHNLTSHSDVTITTPSTGQVLKYNGTAWVNGTDVAGTGDVVGAASSTEGDIVTFSGTTGKVIQGTGLTVTEIVNAINEKADITHNHNASAITAGTLGVERGGTGVGTHTSGNVLIGAGTGAITSLSRSGIDSRTSFPPDAHTHGLISNTGTLTGSPTVVYSSSINLMVRNSTSQVDYSGISLVANTDTTPVFLRRDGTWVIPYSPLAASTVTVSRTITTADIGRTLICSAASTAIVLTLQAMTAEIGVEINIIRYGAAKVSVSPTTVNLFSSGNKRFINLQYEAATLKYVSSNTWVLLGSLSAT
jgi:hypothetical protein